MPKTVPFEKFSKEYEEWFERFEKVYQAELSAVKKLLPSFKNGIEIGAGSGKFALPLGVKEGIEPSFSMAEIARKKGIKIIKGVAEHLPLEDSSYDFVLMITTICFVDDPLKSLQEIWRVLKSGGYLIVGFVDKDSNIGKLYEKNRLKSRFYKEATFFSSQEVIKLLKMCGFIDVKCCQTLFGGALEDVQTDIKDGFGEGAFVAIRAKKEVYNESSNRNKQ